MSKQNYRWKRFWCPRSSNYNSLTDRGYLVDPDTAWDGHKSNLVTLEEIADLPCLILLGEPGIGKSSELERLKELTDKKIDSSDKTLELNLRSCNSLKEDLFKAEIFLDWLKGTHHLYLFLDSLDEGLLNVSNLATVLLDELKQKYRDHIARLHLRLACRTSVFPSILEEGLKELWKKDNFHIYELAPLRRVDVCNAAITEGFSPENFLGEVEQKNIVPLAIKPITLEFLFNICRRNNGQFPANRQTCDFYFEGCKRLCEENNHSRLGTNRVGKLVSDQRLIVAARIAAITIFGNRFAVWTDRDWGNVPAEDVLLEKLCLADDEKFQEKKFEVDRDAIREVLDTGLFSSRDLHRMGWSHQTYAEFLAAWYLVHHEVPLEQIRELIYSPEKSEPKLIPQLHETAAWLASMRPDVFQEIIKTDPDVLLQSDIPTDGNFRAAIVENLLRQYEEEKLFDRYGKYFNYPKLNHPGLAEQLRPYICDSSKQTLAREVAIDIAEICQVSELQEELVNLAIKSSELIYLRASAAKAVGKIGDAETRLKLKHLAMNSLPEDEIDELKGCALRILWPNYLTAEELFQSLTPPKKRNVGGIYRFFLDHEIVPAIQGDDLVIALHWLEKQGVRCFGHPFEILGDEILIKAWDNFDYLGVAAAFTKVVLVQRKEYQEIITRDYNRRKELNLSISNDSHKRHLLIEQIVLQLPKIPESTYLLRLLRSFTKNIVFSKDILWMLDRLKIANSVQEEKTWSLLIYKTFITPESMPEEAKTILEAVQSNSILWEQFSYWITPIDLDSAAAVKMFTEYLWTQVHRSDKLYNSTLIPPPQERVLLCLERLESGDLNSWWQLNMEMTLTPISQVYENSLDLDITKLPGWQNAEESIQKRILEGAKKYIQLKNDLDYEWIGTNRFNYNEFGGCRAFYLLSKENPEFSRSISTETWKKWASVIIAIPNDNQYEDCYRELIKIAYSNAPQECIDTLNKLIDQENQEHGDIYILSRFDRCWDEQLKSALLEKAKDPSLKPKSVSQILDELLQRGYIKAREFVIASLPNSLPSDESDREKFLVPAKLLIKYSDSSDWPLVWSLIQQDTSFGRKVLELTASHSLKLNLTETQLADLYLWLVNQYPHQEDPDHSDGQVYSPTTRDYVADFRNNVLTQLRERSNDRACIEIERLIQELPQIPWLKSILVDTKTNARRNNWQPPTPEAILQLVNRHKTSDTDTINRIDKRTEQMAKEPKIDRSVHINNSPVSGQINTGEGNIQTTTEPSGTEKGFDWKYWLGIALAVAALAVSGLFNDEIKNFFQGDAVPQIEQQLDKK